jgi:hypothetical protein
VTPLLTNDSDVVWGSEDGKLHPDVAYYYKDVSGFRFIFTDTNYSVNPEGEFEHNATNSWGPSQQNTAPNSLSDRQFDWLRGLLFDGAEKNLKCIVFSHASFAAKFPYSADAEKVRTLLNEVNAYKKGTVIAAINGHWHANAYEIKDDILYFNINSAKNGCWLPVNEPHYLPEHTVPYIDFDSAGTETGRRVVPLNSLWMSPKTWFFEAPLSTQVTLYENGDIHIEGMKTRWIHDVVPVGEKVSPCRAPLISEVILKNE